MLLHLRQGALLVNHNSPEASENGFTGRQGANSLDALCRVDPESEDGPQTKVPLTLPPNPAPIKIEVKLEPGSAKESPRTPPPRQTSAASSFLFTPSRSSAIKPELVSTGQASTDAGKSLFGPPATAIEMASDSRAFRAEGNSSSARWADCPCLHF